ncbi:MAG: glycosyltransferase family 2 protein [Armatimonadetes bacterium]|nr:glycosyltransferase family 2 protein [Armatimonadota bacterium]
MKGLITIPVYNEETTLPSIIRGFRSRCPDYHCLFIDDGSSDSSRALLEEHGVAYVHHLFNLGYSATIQTGMQYALDHGYDYVVFFDADGQHRLEDLLTILALAQKGESDLIVGSRYLGNRRNRWTLRRAVHRSLAGIVTLCTGERVTDTTCGLKLITREFMEVALRIPTEDMGAELITALIRHGARVAEVPIEVEERKSGTSMHHSWKVLFYPLKALLCLVTAGLPEKPPSDK